MYQIKKCVMIPQSTNVSPQTFNIQHELVT